MADSVGGDTARKERAEAVVNAEEWPPGDLRQCSGLALQLARDVLALVGERDELERALGDLAIEREFRKKAEARVVELEQALRESANALTNLIAWCDGPTLAHADARRLGVKALRKAREALAGGGLPG